VTPNTVLVIDDHDIVRFGLETLVAACPELRLVGSVCTPADGLRLIAEREPALVISDMTLGDSQGLETVRAVLAAQQPRRTLVVSMHDELLYGEQVLALGAAGYLMKESAHSVVIPAALAVLRGERWVSPRLNAKLLNRLLQRTRPQEPDAAPGASALTLRELEVLELLRGGKTTKQIAFQLQLSARTVDIHRSNMKRKLGLRSAAELIAYASSRA
jgi:DNA-binding NarL/FixJ family response regulator